MSVNLKSMENEIFPKDYSEEAYFGIKSDFSSEMINHVKNLREALRLILGAEWDDESKRTITIKKELENPSKNLSVKLVNVLKDMGDCIARNCNIESCYIGLLNDLNAHTIPIVFDSSHLLNYDKKPVIKKYGELFINSKAIRSDSDIQDQLFKMEDIVLNKDGWKFKDKTGKVFIINIGIPLIVDPTYNSSPEDICSVIFHEIGHNFQQVLRGANQMIIQRYTSYYLSIISDSKFYDIFGFIDNCLINNHLRNVIVGVDKSYQTRFTVIKILLSGMVFVNTDGSVSTREDLGEIERENIMRVITAAKENGTIKTLSFLTKVMGVVGRTIGKLIEFVFLPLNILHRNIINNGLDKDYGDIIKENKIYEQFADTFAVSYGFGSSSSKFYTEIQNYIGSKSKAKPSHIGILNYIPILSTAVAVNEFNRRVMVTNCYGYDENNVRIAQSYRTLDYELTNNPNLSSELKKEIREHMESIKDEYDKYIKLEMENYSSNPNIVKALLAKFRSDDIISVANSSGIVEGVLDVINEYEQTGIVKQPPIVEKFKDLEGAPAVANKFFDKLLFNFETFRSVIFGKRDIGQI